MNESNIEVAELTPSYGKYKIDVDFQLLVDELW